MIIINCLSVGKKAKEPQDVMHESLALIQSYTKCFLVFQTFYFSLFALFS